jgi:hypothetical protein
MLYLLSGMACSMAGGWDAADKDPFVPGDSAAPDTALESGGTTDDDADTLVITEIMKDPDAVSDDLGEWFEVTNTGVAEVDLAGLVVFDADGDAFEVDGALPVAAGAQVVFAASADATQNGGVVPDYAYAVDDLKLSNEGGTIGVRRGDTVVDSVAWDTLPDEEGHAIALDPAAFDAGLNDLVASWCAAATPYGAGDYGTPGSANPSCADAPADRDGDGVDDADDCGPDDADVYAGAPELADGKDDDCDGWVDERAPAAGELVVTEIMDDPDPTDDDTGEWFEVLNVSRDLLVVTGLEVSDTDGESFVVEGELLLDADGLLLFAASADTTENDGLTPDYVFDTGEFHLGNDTDEILLSVEGVLVDEVAYDADFPHEKGKSRSVDPIGMSATRNDDPDYWCKGDGDYGTDGNQGTPGAPNDDCP